MSEFDPYDPPKLDYETPGQNRRQRPLWVVLLWTALLLMSPMLIFFAVRLGLHQHYEPRVKSASNLRQIGQAILLYTNEFGPEYPDSFQTILLKEDVTADVFVSPTSSDTAAQGPTTQATADQLTRGGHLSYVYLGRGLSTKIVTANTIVAYELMSPGASGANVLFGDGRAEYIWNPLVARIVASASAGKFPVTMPSQP